MLVKEKKKLTLRMDAQLIEQAKQYAADGNISVSQLVEAFFYEIERKQHKKKSATPVLDQLTGILPPEASVDEYHDYLAEKYGVS